MTKLAPLGGLLVGAAITLPAMFIAVVSSGAGHGDYGAARLLFPYSMLLTLITGDTIGVLSIVVALIQFPLYGLVIGAGMRDRRWRIAAILMLSIGHGIAALACFAGLLPNFS